MIITLSGQVGAGKSSVGKELAKKLNYKYLVTGEIFKKMAKEKNMDLNEFLKYADANQDIIDKEVDNKQKQAGANTILDSRMGFYFANPELKIWVKAGMDIRIKRIMKRDGPAEKESERHIVEREEEEKERYMRMYSVNIFDMENYDLIIDTGKLNVEQIVNTIHSLVKSMEK
ncbi:MAG: cytidylate kinase family protein [Candidatus Aenigmarchaeota archaeon]|nr:cytidylate kinase family protein [Candidatus Aenigmarchaeota archaeon]